MSLLKRVSRIVSSNVESFIDKQANSHNVKSKRSYNYSHKETEPEANTEELDYRVNLEVGPDASLDEIRTSYKRLMRAYHPDLHALDESKRETAEEITKKLNEAMDYFKRNNGGG